MWCTVPVISKDIHKASPPREIVEGMLVDMLCQIKASLDVLYFSPEVMDPVQNLKATYVVSRMEVQSAVDLLKHHHDAALNARHRATRQVMERFLSLMKENDIGSAELKSVDDEKGVQFITDLVSFMTTAHHMMHVDTETKKRKEFLTEYVGEWILPAADTVIEA